MPQALPDNNPDKIIEDQKSLVIKDKVMARLKANTWYNSVSKAAMYLGGVITTAATGAALGAIFKGTALLAAFTGPVGIALAIGTAIIGVGIITDYAASRIWQGCNFDNLEANADSTARHLVKELKGNNMCLTSEHDAPCTQKKNWAVQVDVQRQQQEAIAAQQLRC